MKIYILILLFLFLISPSLYPQDFPVNKSLNLKTEIDEETKSPLYFYLSYGYAPNEVIFNKDFARSYVSSMSHDFSAGISIVGREKFLMGEFTLCGFYQFSKQSSLKNGDFQMEYNGFGMKAPKASVGAVLGKIEVKMFFPLPLDFSWFKFKMNNYPASFTREEINFLENYNGNFKFSSGREYGLGLNFGKHFGINFGYECRFFHPSYKFLQQQVGNLIEFALYPVAYAFTYARIMSARTYYDFFTGLALFLLPEAASFGILQLKKNSVNWPFSSEAPLYYNAFKISANVFF
jgi:hypothetical protein